MAQNKPCYAQTRGIDTAQPATLLPEAILAVVQRMQRLPDILRIDQLTVNEYMPGVGLNAHLDTHSAFTGASGRVVCSTVPTRWGCNPGDDVTQIINLKLMSTSAFDYMIFLDVISCVDTPDVLSVQPSVLPQVLQDDNEPDNRRTAGEWMNY